MTRKDYINIAAAILATQTRIKGDFDRKMRDLNMPVDTPSDQREQQLRGVRRAAAHLADFLADDNPHHFDKVQFIRNCGYPEPWLRPGHGQAIHASNVERRPIGDCEGMDA